MKNKNIYLIRVSIFLLFISFNFFVNAQLKKSTFGTYLGEIPTYELNTGFNQIPVESVAISIVLSASSIEINTGKLNQIGTYSILFDTKSYYLLEVKLENQFAPERLMVYKKGKKIIREGIRPQPDALLLKQKMR
jgi:hypothetical protein